ncbi:hypothetical protein K503DRAFT_38822 [Rhizopogon vinicolor AM-OR11-026]|uniref:Uncharacterized protein n=1 Tax=Rhizopogon vinicolor AM-OR11-026 TaxID=1314800 RepID=A0A1B7MGY3_9AGAM|nr:hypothetical protein K503DRAFT_38822 [Rhizopogon vinicolor AM-OR11-026]
MASTRSVNPHLQAIAQRRPTVIIVPMATIWPTMTAASERASLPSFAVTWVSPDAPFSRRSGHTREGHVAEARHTAHRGVFHDETFGTKEKLVEDLNSENKTTIGVNVDLPSIRPSSSTYPPLSRAGAQCLGPSRYGLAPQRQVNS